MVTRTSSDILELKKSRNESHEVIKGGFIVESSNNKLFRINSVNKSQKEPSPSGNPLECFQQFWKNLRDNKKDTDTMMSTHTDMKY